MANPSDSSSIGSVLLIAPCIVALLPAALLAGWLLAEHRAGESAAAAPGRAVADAEAFGDALDRWLTGSLDELRGWSEIPALVEGVRRAAVEHHERGYTEENARNKSMRCSCTTGTSGSLLRPTSTWPRRSSARRPGCRCTTPTSTGSPSASSASKTTSCRPTRRGGAGRGPRGPTRGRSDSIRPSASSESGLRCGSTIRRRMRPSA